MSAWTKCPRRSRTSGTPSSPRTSRKRLFSVLSKTVLLLRSPCLMKSNTRTTGPRSLKPKSKDGTLEMRNLKQALHDHRAELAEKTNQIDSYKQVHLLSLHHGSNAFEIAGSLRQLLQERDRQFASLENTCQVRSPPLTRPSPMPSNVPDSLSITVGSRDARIRELETMLHAKEKEVQLSSYRTWSSPSMPTRAVHGSSSLISRSCPTCYGKYSLHLHHPFPCIHPYRSPRSSPVS